VTFLPVLVAPAAVISAEWHLGGLLLQSEDILAATVAAAWTTLGLALARATR
jgi:hypothetical protein